MSLTAALTVSASTDPRTLDLTLRITNPEERTIAILNPDMGVPSPAMKWPYSTEAYQAFLLMSFGYLSISVTDEAGGKPLPPLRIDTSATPALRPPVELGPGDSLEVPIPIGSFYQLESGKAYRVTITYGDQKLKLSATTRVAMP